VGNYDLSILTKFIIGGLAGALVGTYLTTLAPRRAFRVALFLWLISLGVLMYAGGKNHHRKQLQEIPRLTRHQARD
jgi:uncharacterized membrane protein YfcA